MLYIIVLLKIWIALFSSLVVLAVMVVSPYICFFIIVDILINLKLT